MAKKSQSKRLILINRDLQFRYARIAFVIGFISTILSTVVILYPLFEFEKFRESGFLPPTIIVGMITAMIINLAFVLYLAIIITHRIAGPMFALSREFAEVSQGIFGRKLTVRKHDDLQYLIRSFNDMSQSLKNLTFDDIARLKQIQMLAQNLLPTEEKTKDTDKHAANLKELNNVLESYYQELKERVEEQKKDSTTTQHVS